MKEAFKSGGKAVDVNLVVPVKFTAPAVPEKNEVYFRITIFLVITLLLG